MVSILEMATTALGSLTGALGLAMVVVGFLATHTRHPSLHRITSLTGHGKREVGVHGLAPKRNM